MINTKYPTIKPSLNLDFANTKSLDPRITFRRGTPGTYYDGVTHVKAEENLLSYSEKFDQSGTTFGLWDTANVNLTTDSTDEFLAPNGTQTAWKFSDAGTTNANHGLFQQVYTTDSSQEIITTSIFGKAGDADRYLQILHGIDDTNYGFPFANFDLFNGTITRNEETLNASMTDAGNGWYRCSITFFTTTVSAKDINPVFYMVNSPTAARDEYYTGDGSSGFYLWGAQLEQRDAVTAYTATTGTPIIKYQPKLMTAAADRARFDHDPITGESKGLLIEEQRTNLVQDSEFIEDISTNGVWWNQTATVSSVKKNQTISPTGQLNATKIIYNTNATSGGLVMKYHTDASTGDAFTGSVYLKAGNLDKVKFYFNSRNSGGSSVASPAVIADLSLGVIDSTVDSAGMTISDSSIDNVGNGWYRVAMTSTVITGVDVISLGIYMSGGPTNSTALYDHFFVWGAQMEKASFPTSYIKTTGASVTRSADNASITGENFSSWYRQDEGSVSVDYNLYSIEANSTIFSFINPDNVQGYINLYCMGALNQQLNCRISNLSATSENMILENTATTGQHNVCVGYSDTNASSVIDSGDILESSISASFKADTLLIGRNTQPVVMNGHIKKLAYYPQRLTNEQLQNLTK